MDHNLDNVYDEYRRIIRFCIDEIEIQGDSPNRIFHMYEGWVQAQAHNDIDGLALFCLKTVHDIYACCMRPFQIKYRQTPVYFTNGNDGQSWETIPYTITTLIEAVQEARITPQEFYDAYEMCHPWEDGNGRTGQILANWINNTLDNPIRFDLSQGEACPLIS